MKHPLRYLATFLLIGASCWWLGCRQQPAPATDDSTLMIYSGRSEDLMAPLFDLYRERTGVDLQVRYGGSTEMAATILEEGRNSPADVFVSQEAGALGALARQNSLQVLPSEVLDQVEPRFRSPGGQWVGLSGRARVVVVNSERVKADDLPESLAGFTEPRWKGRIGWAPANASFQSFVTALRATEGEDRAREWLSAMQANEPKVYPKNTAIVIAAAAGEIDAGLCNHYYLHTLRSQGAQVGSASNAYLRAGTMVNATGAGILRSSKRAEQAADFVRFLLSPEAQNYFATKTFEYPLARDIPTPPDLPALKELVTPELDLNKLEDLQGTLRMLQDLGIL